MNRRKFIRNMAVITAMGGAGQVSAVNQSTVKEQSDIMETKQLKPRAITMWDFSWLERRWPGAGYEDWDLALDQLLDRGYNAVRIDAYPHLVHANPEKEWTLLPVWDQQIWGSPDINKVVVQPALNQFLAKCKERDIKVGLSTWYREDIDNTRIKIASSKKMAEIWITTLESIDKEGLLDAILYVDLCNEWPGDLWAPYFINDPPEYTWTYWHTQKSIEYMRESIELVKKAFPQLPCCYSFTGGNPDLYAEKDLSFFNLMEHHVWMSQLKDDEYYKQVGYDYGRFSPQAYKNLVANYERVYRERPDYWRNNLVQEISRIAKACHKAGLPLITTECWGLVDFKDWPLLKWDIIKELCELGVKTAAASGQWIAIATSNFCGPQFTGMWRDIEWHRNLTDVIRGAVISPSLINNKHAEIMLSRL